MVVIDADVLLIDQRYTGDARFIVNRQFFSELQQKGIQLGITSEGLLEAVGCLSFGTPQPQIVQIPGALEALYQFWIIPDKAQHPIHSGCSFDEIMLQITKKMSLGDAT